MPIFGGEALREKMNVVEETSSHDNLGTLFSVFLFTGALLLESSPRDRVFRIVVVIVAWHLLCSLLHSCAAFYIICHAQNGPILDEIKHPLATW